MAGNGRLFPFNHINNNSNGKRKRSLSDSQSTSGTSEKYSKKESGPQGASSSSPEESNVEGSSIGAAEERRQIITRAQGRSDENENVEPSSDPLEKKKESAGILRLFKKYCDECGSNEELLSVSDLNDEIWFKSADVAKTFGYNPFSDPVANIQKENKSRFDGLSHKNTANISPLNIGKNTIFIDTDGVIDLICNSAKLECKKFLKWLLLTAAHNDMTTEISRNQKTVNVNMRLFELTSENNRLKSLLEEEITNLSTVFSTIKEHAETAGEWMKNLLLDNKSSLQIPSTSGSQDTQQNQQLLNCEDDKQGFYILQHKETRFEYKFFQRQFKSIKSTFNSFQNQNGDYRTIYPKTPDAVVLTSKAKAIDIVKNFLYARGIRCTTVKTTLTIKSEDVIDLPALLINGKVKF